MRRPVQCGVRSGSGARFGSGARSKSGARFRPGGGPGRAPGSGRPTGPPGAGGPGLADGLFGPPAARRRRTLATRVALVTTAVAVVAVLVAGLVSLGLVRSAGDADARRTLAALADAAADAGAGGRLTGPAARRAQTRARLTALKIDFTFITRGGGTTGGPAEGRAARALTAAEREEVVAGRPLSLTRDVGGTRTLVEARQTTGGGIVLAQALSDASFAREAVGRIGIALLVGLAVAVLAGILLARLLARPLRRAATAAHDLARGRRDVRLPPEGPAEVAEVADALTRLSGALATSEGRQRDFLLSVSHELRTPLTAITGFAESLADGVTTGADVRPVGRTVLGEARRLDRLVSDLLDLARLGAQDFRIDLHPVDLTALVASAGDVWRARCEAVGVRAQVDAAAPPGALRHRRDPGPAGPRRPGRERAAGHPGRRPGRARPVRAARRRRPPGPRRRPRADPGGLRGRLRAVRAVRALPRRPAGRHRRRAGPGARAGHPARRHRGGRPGGRGRRLLHRPAAAGRTGPVPPDGRAPAAARRGRVRTGPKQSVGSLLGRTRRPTKGPA